MNKIEKNSDLRTLYHKITLLLLEKILRKTNPKNDIKKQLNNKMVRKELFEYIQIDVYENSLKQISKNSEITTNIKIILLVTYINVFS